MIVAKSETFWLRIPFKSDTGAAISEWGDQGLPAADSLLVRVTTGQGLEGWGEPFGFRAVRSAKLAIEELIAPVSIGKEASSLMPHAFYDGPGLLAAIYVTAALGTTDAMIEWRYFDLESQLYGGAISPKGGRISVPQCPGLGIDPDPNVIRTYLRQVGDSICEPNSPHDTRRSRRLT